LPQTPEGALSVFALGIAVETPQPTLGGEELQRKARPAGERPGKKLNCEQRLTNADFRSKEQITPSP